VQRARELRAVRGRTAGSRPPASAFGRARPPLCTLSGAQGEPPPADTALVVEKQPAVPRFSWRLVLFFAANPLALLPVAGIGALLHVGIGGVAFTLTPTTALLGAALALPLQVITSLPLERIPGLRAIEEITTVSQFLCYLLFGARRSLGHMCKVLAASTLISAAAGVAEELVFRGTLQTGLSTLLAAVGAPAALLPYLSIGATSVLFGLLHSYSSSPAYAIAAFIASLYFGALFAATGNIVVPVLAHFTVDLVSFVQGYFEVVYRKTDAERDALWRTDQPIARTLRLVAGYAE